MSAPEKQNPLLQKVLFVAVLVVLLLPGVTGLTRWYHEKPVDGAWITPEAPTMTAQTVWSSEFQKQYELWMNEHVGFHYSMIRLRNQIWYSCFRSNIMPDAVIGNNAQLYLTGYVSAYMGNDYIGEEAITSLTEKLKILQDTLEKHNVTLLVIMAPGKASVYPEDIPASYGPRASVTNHSSMRNHFDSAGVNLIDFNSYFAERRDQFEFPVYSNTSVHWTNYAALVALDSVVKYIEHKRNIDMPSIVFDGAEWSDVPTGFDNDVGSGLNLMFPIENYAIASPKYHYENSAGKTKISLMSVADSYIRMMMACGMTENLTTTHDYWYYNQGIEHSDGRPKSSVLDEDIAASTLKHDVVIIMATETNYAGFSWGYIHDAFRAIILKEPLPEKERIIRQKENDIRMSKKWLYEVQQKALARRIPLDSMIRMDAEYAAEEYK